MGTWSEYGYPTEPRTRTISEEEWDERVEIVSFLDFAEREMSYSDSLEYVPPVKACLRITRKVKCNDYWIDHRGIKHVCVLLENGHLPHLCLCGEKWRKK